MAYVAQADAVGDVGIVLAHISTSAKRWVIDRIIDQLIDFFATSHNNVAFLECIFSSFHIIKLTG